MIPRELLRNPWVWHPWVCLLVSVVMFAAFAGTIWLLQHGHGRIIIWIVAGCLVALVVLLSIVL